MQGQDEIKYNYNPVKVYEGFINAEGELRAVDINWLSLIKCLERYSISHECVGKEITIWIVSHDSRVNRSVAIHLATAIAMGTIKRHSIKTTDLVGFFTHKKRANER